MLNCKKIVNWCVVGAWTVVASIASLCVPLLCLLLVMVSGVEWLVGSIKGSK